MSALRGIRRVSTNKYVDIHFDTQLRQDGGNGSNNRVDRVRIKFRDIQGGAWGSIIKMYEKLMTGKAIVFTIADTYDEPPFYNLQEGKTKRDPSTAAGDWDQGPNNDGNPYYGETTSPSINEENLDDAVIVEYLVVPGSNGDSYP